MLEWHISWQETGKMTDFLPGKRTKGRLQDIRTSGHQDFRTSALQDMGLRDFGTSGHRDIRTSGLQDIRNSFIYSRAQELFYKLFSAITNKLVK